MHTFGTLGDSLDSAQQTGFFRWFHLEEVGAAKDANNNDVVEFRPSGEKFHDLVSLRVTCDAGRRMLALELALDRQFIDSPRNGVFAADCAKSFLLSATSDVNLDLVKPLAEAIEVGSYHRSASPVILHSDRLQSPPQGRSPGYETYLGRREEWRHAPPLHDGVQLWLQNETHDGKGVLVMRLR